MSAATKTPELPTAQRGTHCVQRLVLPPYVNPNPRVGVLLRQGGASVRLYNRLNPRFGKRGLNWLKRNWPESRLRRELPGYGEAVSCEWNAILAHRQNNQAEP